MDNNELTSEICIICREAQNKYVKIEGIYRDVIFELLSEISCVKIVDDHRLPTSICCNCSVQLQLAKSTLDKLKKQEKSILTHPFQCRACLGPIKKHLVVNIYNREVEKKIGKCLADVLQEMSMDGSSLQSTTNVCRPCSDMISSFAIIKDLIIASNAKLIEEIPPQIDDPLGDLMITDEYDISTLPDVLDIKPEITSQPMRDGQHEVFIQQMPLQDQEEQHIKEEVTIKIVQSENPVQVDKKTEQSKTKKWKCLKHECDLFFFTKAARLNHMKAGNHLSRLNQENKFFCYCGLTFDTKQEESDHIRKNHNVKFKCNGCEKIAFTLIDIKRHLTDEHDGGYFTVTLLTKLLDQDGFELFRCSICNIDNYTFEEFKDHCRKEIHLQKATHYCKGQNDGIATKKNKNSNFVKSYDSDETMSCDGDNKIGVQVSRNSIKSDLKTLDRINIKSELILNDPKLNMIASVQLTRMNLPQKANVTIFKVEPVEPQSIHDDKKVRIEIVADHSKPKSAIKKSSVPIITAVVSLHPVTITREIPNPDDITPDNIDSNFEFVDESHVFCKTCNRVMNPAHYKHHLKSRYHSFFIEFPEFRSEKIKRQQKRTEHQIMQDMKFWCEICSQSVPAFYWSSHLKRVSHKFLLDNPDFRPNKQKSKKRKYSFDKDIPISEMQSTKTVICDFCRKTFRMKEKLEQHVKRHCETFFYHKCKLCDRKFSKFNELMNHSRRDHVDDTSGKYSCKDCNKTYSHHKELLYHANSYKHLANTGRIRKKEKKISEPKIYKCLICSLRVRSRAGLSSHWAAFHAHEELSMQDLTPESNETVCKLCRNQFEKPNDLQIHYVMDHDKIETKNIISQKPIVCHCEKSIIPCKFKSHHENFHPASTLCFICGQNFEKVEDFRYHRDFGHLQYESCTICSVFKTQSRALLLKHRQNHKYNDRKGSYQLFVCEFCGYKCRHKFRFDHHLSINHQIGESKDRVTDVKERRIHKCDQCDKSYVERKDLRNHQKYTHEGVAKPHSCEVCSMTFCKPNQYLRHVNSAPHLKKCESILNGSEEKNEKC